MARRLARGDGLSGKATAVLTPAALPDLQRAIADADMDGWLLFDFQGCNPIAGGMLGLRGMVTRRIFVWIPREGVPSALGHAIEPGPWRTWPSAWQHATYSSWRELEQAVGTMVRGKRIAMEYSAGDAVPYLDRVPAGVLEMVRAAGAREIVSSGALVTRFVASWTPAHVASHRRAAAIIRQVALDAFTLVGQRARTPQPIAEHELMAWMLDRFERAGVSTDHGPNVSAGSNAANPHYEPSADRPRPIVEGDVLLIDLWARETDGVWADQTWMATVGPPSARAQEIWRAIRDARDAAIQKVRDDVAAGRPLRGGDVDDAARAVIESRGLGRFFTHRTGHSIDPRSLHGAGPHLDNLETREERLLVAGVGFSIEPGVYVPGEIGMRTEVNAYLEEGRAVITPDEYQRELIVV
ncbi:MAG TPA: M24 family metallopeptidase [Gemmatimonadaceae bacterium]|nr:M24 family metallopeptidase [Gemmatimonadaceae bacterium]